MQPPTLAVDSPALTDPFYLVKDEVQQSVNQIMSMHSRWRELLADEASALTDFERATQDLATQARATLDDLGMMQESINVVEQKPKFGITPEEILARREFVRKTQEDLRAILRETQDTAAHAKLQKKQRETLLASSRPRESKKERYEKLEKQMEQDNQATIDGEMQRQALVIKQQDQSLDAVFDTTKRLKVIATDMGHEIQEQDKLLDGLEQSVDKNKKKISFLTKQMDKLIKHKDRGKFCLIFLLLIILIVLVGFLIKSAVSK